MSPNTPASASPPPRVLRAPGVLQGTVLAAVFAAVCFAWAIDRAHVRGDFSNALHRLDCGALPGATVTGRLHIEDCELHLPSASLVLDGTEVVGGYARLRSTAGPTDAMPVLLRVSDPAQLALLGQAFRAQALAEDADTDAWVKTHLVELVPRTDLQGVVLRGRHLDGTDRDHLQLHAGALAADAGILAASDTLPSPWAPAMLGLLLAALALWGWRFPPSGITAGLGTGGDAR